MIEKKSNQELFFFKFSYFDELLAPFSSALPQTRSSTSSRKSRGYAKQTSFDSIAFQRHKSQVKQNLTIRF